MSSLKKSLIQDVSLNQASGSIALSVESLYYIYSGLVDPLIHKFRILNQFFVFKE